MRVSSEGIVFALLFLLLTAAEAFLGKIFLWQKSFDPSGHELHNGLPMADTRCDDGSDSSFSLASTYLVQVSNDQWKMSPIENSSGDLGARSLDSLYAFDCTPSAAVPAEPPVSFSIKLNLNGKRVASVQLTNEDETGSQIDMKLVGVLSRLLVQHSIGKTWKDVSEFQFPGEDVQVQTVNLSGITDENEAVLKIFEPLVGSDPTIELVEMVDRDGQPLGRVPRILIHKHNLLHRGIGLVVTDKNNQLYVHRRTDSKRIFPSLYDMFVGGISLAGEEARITAMREVAEELGLKRGEIALSATPHFTCTVCTAYNRCVVPVFTYAYKEDEDNVSWQEEEVAWGTHVPYDVVVAAADRSIDRMIQRNTWPGHVPSNFSERLQRKWGSYVEGYKCSDQKEDWRHWDFVPDGLLVWEAWLKWKEQGDEQRTSSIAELSGVVVSGA